jgi:hypothetical protein
VKPKHASARPIPNQPGLIEADPNDHMVIEPKSNRHVAVKEKRQRPRGRCPYRHFVFPCSV